MKSASGGGRGIHPLARSLSLASSQVPWGVGALAGTATAASWKVKPSWYLIAGVHGVVRSSCTTGELIAAIPAVAQGSVYVPPEIARRMVAGEREELTGREQEVLRLLARGQCNKLIGRHLGIAVGTLKTHVKGIMTKLDSSSRREAARIASEKGIVEALKYPSSIAGARSGHWRPIRHKCSVSFRPKRTFSGQI